MYGEFLLYSPLNQGLKRNNDTPSANTDQPFLLYSPLNQGLKPVLYPSTDRKASGFYSTVH